MLDKLFWGGSQRQDKNIVVYHSHLGDLEGKTEKERMKERRKERERNERKDE